MHTQTNLHIHTCRNIHILAQTYFPFEMNAVCASVPILGRNRLGEVHFPCLVFSVSLHHTKVSYSPTKVACETFPQNPVFHKRDLG